MGQKIGSMAVGSIVKIKENGTPQEYIIVHHGNPNPAMYDASCNGTWLNRKNAISNYGSWGSYYNQYRLSNIHINLQDEWPTRYEANIKKLFKSVKIPYGTGKGNSSVNTGSDGLTCTFFAPSALELGATLEYYMTNDGARLSYFTQGDSSEANQKRAAKYLYWTRTPVTNERETAYTVKNDGAIQGLYPTASGAGIRPMCILPDNLIVDDSGNLTDATMSAPTLSAPVSAMVGTKINLSWTTSEGATQYILERNTGSGWSSVYTGPNTSFEDTVGSWSTVQYRIAASDGTNKSDYGMSSAITVISADALVISGEDSYLGVLKSDVVYSVSTDTGNQITLERKVNNVTIATITVDNGFAYSIPVMDLPSGFGTITLTASVQASSGKVSKTRTWTYNKEALTFPMDADIAAYQHNGRTIYPATIAEAVRTPTVMGGSLDKTLELIAPIIGSSVVAAGTYTGTGQFGPDHPNVIDLGAEALVVTIYGDGKTLVISNTSSGSPGVISGTTCTWYSDVSAEEQLNKLDTLYSYVTVMTTK